jgi:hypothetical protein
MGAVLATTAFASYIPEKDPRQCTQVTVLDGKNFVPAQYGLKAYFGSEIYFSEQFGTSRRQHVQLLRCGDMQFFGTPDGVYAIDDTSKLLYPLFSVTVVDAHWPWTVAYVGKKYYFAQYEIGLWEYTPDTQQIRHVVTPVYDNAIWVCAAFGRLMLLAPTYICWSAMDDGSDLTPLLSTGAGAQGISLIGGTAFRVDPVVNGVIVATSNGLLKGTKVDETYVFSWKVTSREMELFSPLCACTIPDTGILYVDEHGIHFVQNTDTSSVYTTLAVFEAEMGEYFRRTYLKTKRSKVYGNVYLAYSYAERAVFFAFSDSGAVGFFTQAYVYSIETGKWGLFNHAFTAIFDSLDDAGLWRCCYLDAVGTLRQLTDHYYSEETISAAKWTEYSRYAVSDPNLLILTIDSVNTKYQNPDTGELVTDVEQTSSYAPGCELFYNDGPLDMPLVSGQPSGLYTIARNDLRETADFSEGTISITDVNKLYGSVADSEPQSGAVLEGGHAVASDLDSGPYVSPEVSTPIECAVYDDLNFCEDDAVYYSQKAYSIEKVALDSSTSIGPFRITQGDSVTGSCYFTFVKFGLSSVGVSETVFDWNSMSSAQTIDWNDVEEAETVDWGMGDPTTYSYDFSLDMTNDGWPTSSIYTDIPVLINSTQYSRQYSFSGYVGVHGVMTLTTKNVGDFFYLKTIDLGGMPAGRQY